jgi:hypothetical protein
MTADPSASFQRNTIMLVGKDRPVGSGADRQRMSPASSIQEGIRVDARDARA